MSDDNEPLLRVVRGNPTEDELAALVTVLAAAARGDETAPPPRASTWSAYWSSHRAPVTPGVGAWQASALPR